MRRSRARPTPRKACGPDGRGYHSRPDAHSRRPETLELATLTLSEAACAIAARRLSPVDLVQACLERIEALDGQVNAFLTVCAEPARRQARRAEQAVARGEPLGALHGIPFAVKDLFDARDLRTTAGTRLFGEPVAQADAATVARLREAGAILLGKLNLNELAVGATGENPHFGRTHNPWRLSHLSGGSSSGAAAALAAGFCQAALGTDTGGSIRVPASLCGVVGLKPNYGRISLRGVRPLSWTLDHAGPLARSVEDAARLLQACAGHDPLDPFSASAYIGDYLAELDSGVRGWRVGLAAGSFLEPCEPDVAAALAEAGRVYADLGARVEGLDLSWVAEARAWNRTIVAVECGLLYADPAERSPESVGPEALARFRSAAHISARDYAAAMRARPLFRQRLIDLFADHDVLLLPATPLPAPPAEDPRSLTRARELLSTYAGAFNLAGVPALAFPGGRTRDGLPIGLQLIGPPWGEARVLAAGRAYEVATSWRAARPVLTRAG